MKLALLFLAGCCVAAEAPAVRAPVLLELFTSEGCSSCPPADRLLEKFDSTQPISGADLIVLSEHVDYWNQLGWKDPFSSARFSQRQRDYAESLGGDVYTPELVVDGAKGFVGNDEGEARRVIHDSLHAAKAPIRIEVNGGKILLRLDRAVEGTLWLALAHDSMKSQVTRGKTRGSGFRTSRWFIPWRRWRRSDGNPPLTAKFRSSPHPGETTRIVAFVQKPEMGRVVALGQTRFDQTKP